MRTISVEFIALHKCRVVLLLDQVERFLSCHKDSEVKVSKDDLDVVVEHTIVLVLSASLTFVALLDDLYELLMPLTGLLTLATRDQVAINKAKACILIHESGAESSLITERCQLHLTGGDVSNLVLQGLLGNEHHMESEHRLLLYSLILFFRCFLIEGPR